MRAWCARRPPPPSRSKAAADERSLGHGQDSRDAGSTSWAKTAGNRSTATVRSTPPGTGVGTRRWRGPTRRTASRSSPRRLALVGHETGEVDEARHVVGGAGHGGDRAAVGVTDEHDRGLGSWRGPRRQVGGVAVERAVRYGGRHDADPVVKQVRDDSAEAGGIGEGAVHENDSGLGHGGLPGRRRREANLTSKVWTICVRRTRAAFSRNPVAPGAVASRASTVAAPGDADRRLPASPFGQRSRMGTLVFNMHADGSRPGTPAGPRSPAGMAGRRRAGHRSASAGVPPGAAARQGSDGPRACRS